MCLQAALTIAFIVVGGGFRSLINFAVVASWAFYFLTVRYLLLVSCSVYLYLRLGFGIGYLAIQRTWARTVSLQ